MKVLILRGLPGSGKSTWARQYQQLNKDQKIIVCSADDYFDGGPIDKSKTGVAHDATVLKFLSAVTAKRAKADTVIVDNNHLTSTNIAPFYTVARALGHEVMIVNFLCTLEEALARNTHGVQKPELQHMMGRQRKPYIPKWWIQVTPEMA